MENNRNEWLARRKVGIGGSDVAALLGVSPWKTALDVYYDKVGTGRDDTETEAMRIGTELEDYVARSYERETARTVRRFNTLLQRGHCIGNIDRLVVPEGAKMASWKGSVKTDTLLECKTATAEWPDGVPEHYICQVQHYMGLDEAFLHADVAVLFIGFDKKFRIHRVERDDSLIVAMQSAVEAFWTEHVEKRIPPAPQNENDCRRLWLAQEPGKVVEADDALVEVAEALRDTTANLKTLEEKEKTLRAMLMAALGDGETLMHDGVKLATWKQNKATEKTDWQAVANRLNPSSELVEEFTTTKPGARVFRLALK